MSARDYVLGYRPASALIRLVATLALSAREISRRWHTFTGIFNLPLLCCLRRCLGVARPVRLTTRQDHVHQPQKIPGETLFHGGTGATGAAGFCPLMRQM